MEGSKVREVSSVGTKIKNREKEEKEKKEKAANKPSTSVETGIDLTAAVQFDTASDCEYCVLLLPTYRQSLVDSEPSHIPECLYCTSTTA